MVTRGFGLAGEAPLETIRNAVVHAEAMGYHTFWLSQPAARSTLTHLHRAVRDTATMRLGVGAIPLTKLGPGEIVNEIATLELPTDRLRLGIGSGTGPGSLARMRDGLAELRRLISVEIVVAPLGPKMCTLAGELADTILLNWLTPAHAVRSIEWVDAGASAARRERPEIAAYVRCALGEESTARLRAECDRYGAFPHYAAHFVRQGVTPVETTIHEREVSALRDRLATYEAVLDHVVVRAITPQDRPNEIRKLLDATSPGFTSNA